MSRTKLFFKEFIFIPCLVFALAILFSKISLFNFFKSNINEFNGVKVIFVTVLSVILLESFLMFDVPKNLLFSRTIASIVMMATFFLFSFYFVRLKEVVNVIAAVFLGAVTNYIFQSFPQNPLQQPSTTFYMILQLSRKNICLLEGFS